VDEKQRVVRCIDGEVKIAIAAVEEVSHLMGDLGTPLHHLQVLLYQDRCDAIIRDLRHLAEMTAKAAQSPT
jgi:hypothetical protein